MKIEELKTLLELAKKEGVSKFKYEDKEFKCSFLIGGAEKNIAQYVQQVPQLPLQSVEEVGKVSGQQKGSDNSRAGLHEIKSPLVGTFYKSPSPGKPEFVQVGTRVKKGQVLGIIEAMKIMNEIDSDVDGEVVEICIENEGLVEFGQTLFVIK